MKHIISLIICLCCFSLTACGNPPIDTLVNRNKNDIEKLNQELEQTRKQCEDLQEQIDDLKGKTEESIADKYSVVILICSILGVLGLLISIFQLVYNEEDDDTSELRNQINSLQQSNIKRKNEIDSLKKTQSGTSNKRGNEPPKSSDEYDQLVERIKNVENQLESRLKEQDSILGTKKDSNEKKMVPTEIKSAYLGAPTGAGDKMYFIDELPSCDDKARFKIFKKSDKEADFDLIDIQRIKSMDSFDSVAKTRGCNLAEAKDFSTINKGKLVKEDGCWAVKRCLEINLKK